MPKANACRGQVAMEFILIVGLVILIVVAAAPVLQKQNELNKAIAAARDGATFAAGMRGMGYEGKDVTEMPEGVVKIEGLYLVDKTDDLSDEEKGRVQRWYQIRFNVSAPDYMKGNTACSGSSIGMTIRKRSISYINYAFYGNWTPEDELKVFTPRFKFTTACDFA